MTNRLHIYAQTYYHDHAFIVGDREALKLLRDAINSALSGENGRATSFTADGEGFDLEVYREDGDAFWDQSRRPYTDKNAEDTREDAIGPWDLYKKHHPK